MSKETGQKIYVDQAANDTYFNSKFPTAKNGYCYITRTISNIVAGTPRTGDFIRCGGRPTLSMEETEPGIWKVTGFK